MVRYNWVFIHSKPGAKTGQIVKNKKLKDAQESSWYWKHMGHKVTKIIKTSKL